VWVITGDGDALSIGGNHILHAMRRNVDLKILMFNNRIYGLTKGQVSPTSEQGKVTRSTPLGSVDRPFEALSVVLGAGATFAARVVDTEAALLSSVLRRAAAHRGTAFIEILQNCPVFNDGAHEHLTDKATKAERQLVLEQGKPLLFGKDRKRGLRVGASFAPEVVAVGGGEGEVSEGACAVHDEASAPLAGILAQLAPPEFPVALGVLRAVRRPTLNELTQEQEQQATAAKGEASLFDLLHAGETWTVKPTVASVGDGAEDDELGAAD
jgi:2-oxoglutarate ferredoxin oxidoreductase subunit beta